MGIDASTKKTGYAIFDNRDLLTYGAIEVPDKNMEWRDRIIYMIKELAGITGKFKPHAMCVEVPIKSLQNTNTSAQLFSLHGALLGMASSLNVHFIPMEVSEWRKELGLLKDIPKMVSKDKRTILKERSIKLANTLFDLELQWKSKGSQYNDDDISDAILIAYALLQRTSEGFGVIR